MHNTTNEELRTERQSNISAIMIRQTRAVFDVSGGGARGLNPSPGLRQCTSYM